MAAQQFEKGQAEYELFNDFWKLFKAFWIPEDTDEYWKQLHDAAVAYGNHHGEFAKQLALAYISEVERRFANEQKGKTL